METSLGDVGVAEQILDHPTRLGTKSDAVVEVVRYQHGQDADCTVHTALAPASVCCGDTGASYERSLSGSHGRGLLLTGSTTTLATTTKVP